MNPQHIPSSYSPRPKLASSNRSLSQCLFDSLYYDKDKDKDKDTIIRDKKDKDKDKDKDKEKEIEKEIEKEKDRNNKELKSARGSTGNSTLGKFLRTNTPDNALERQQTLFHVASTLGDQKLLRSLLKRNSSDVNNKDLNGWTAIHCAAANGHIRTIEVLLESRDKDVDWFATTNERNSVLHYLVRNPPAPAELEWFKGLLERVIEKGLLVNMQNLYGETPLHSACLKANKPAAQVLLLHSASSNIQTYLGETPLHYSVRAGSIELVKLLLKHGADPLVISHANETAMDVASEYNQLEIYDYLSSAEPTPGETKEDTFSDSFSFQLSNPSRSASRLGAIMPLSSEKDLETYFIVGRGLQELEEVYGFDIDEDDELLRLLLSFFAQHNKTQDLLRWSISREIKNTQSGPTLFRGISVATKLLGLYSFDRLGLKYLKKTLLSLVSEVTTCKASFEIDPNKALESGCIDVKKNLERLLNICQELLDKIFRTYEKFPLPIRALFRYTREEVDKKFPEMQRLAIGGLLFLRFLCPAIVTPEKYGLISAPPSTESRRTLILISKILQNLANAVQFDGSKEAYMMGIDNFIVENLQAVNNFFDNLTSVYIDQVTLASPKYQFSHDSSASSNLHEFFLTKIDQRVL